MAARGSAASRGRRWLAGGLAVACAWSGTALGAEGFEEDARRTLEALLRVDTSHGNETAALRPIAARLEQAGVKVELLEAAPGRANLVARLPGTGGKRPLLLGAHVDVVPVEGQPWTSPPFTPTEREGYLVARGINDDKAMAAGFVAIVLEAARQKVRLERDLLLVLTADEERGGAEGMGWLVEHRPELREAEYMLGEDGDVQLGPGGEAVQTLWVDVDEKASWSFRLVAKGRGGHSSRPWSDTDPVAQLARALLRVAGHRWPWRVLPVVQGSLRAMAGRSAPALAAALTHAAEGAPSPADEQLLAADPLLNALTRSTCVATMLQAAPAANILPDTAEATVNCRLLPDEVPEAFLAELQRVVGDPEVRVTPLGASPRLPGALGVDQAFLAAVRRVAATQWPGAEVVPTIATGGSDARFLRRYGVKAFGVGRLPGTAEELRLGHAGHGADERRLVRWIPGYFRYLKALVVEVAR